MLELCNFSSELCNFLSLLCLFLVIILASEKASMDGYNVADWYKNNGLGRIRTGDLRGVKATDSGLLGEFFRGAVITRNAKAPS